jgi:ADP-ribose pyrophosphatase YjhB (NUDIX family)
MGKSDNPLTPQEFDDIYSKVPRLTVEIILRNEKNEILLSKRAIAPCEGQWHLPGGTVRFGEPLIEAVYRIAKRELNIDVLGATNVGYIEYPSHYEKGLDSPVGIVFEVNDYAGTLKVNNESLGSAWFLKLPKDIHADQDDFLVANDYLQC